MVAWSAVVAAAGRGAEASAAEDTGAAVVGRSGSLGRAGVVEG